MEEIAKISLNMNVVWIMIPYCPYMVIVGIFVFYLNFKFQKFILSQIKGTPVNKVTLDSTLKLTVFYFVISSLMTLITYGSLFQIKYNRDYHVKNPNKLCGPFPSNTKA